MIFWLAVIVGGLVAWNAAQIGFFDTWILFFHLVLAGYAAIFFAPVVVNEVAAATATSWGLTFTLMGIAIAALAIGYGVCFLLLSGNFTVEFPKAFDTLVAGFLGFLAGFFAFSFVVLALCVSPLSEENIFQQVGLDMASQTTTTGYVYWWCDWLHCLVGADAPHSSDEAISLLTAKPTAPAAPPPKPKPLKKPGLMPKPNVKPMVNGRTPAKPAGANGGKTQVAVVAKPNVPIKPKIEQHRPGESWEQELARRRMVVSSPEELAVAIAKPEIKIIEVADSFTADKFTPKQTQSLQHWTSEGGVVWATNDVLSFFGILQSKLVWWGGGLDCAASGKKTPILTGCAKVTLKDAGGKAHSLAAKGVIPLLVLEKDIPFESKAGTACWSLVPYGRGWVSDAKSVDAAQYDGGQFWPNFCQFCLGRNIVVSTKTQAAGAATSASALKGPLAGTWQASNGTSFRFDDDGMTVTITGIADALVKSCTGTLVRNAGDATSKSLAGSIDITFVNDTRKKYTTDMTVIIEGDNSLRVRCVDWPVWNKNGKYLGTRPATVVWTRSKKPNK